MLVDPTKTYVFIWVPGTMGHEVHPAFQAAIDKLCPHTSQVLCVDYPASWDFDESVPLGEASFTKLLKAVVLEKADHQKVLVGGSSQGAWVIGNVYKDTPYVETFAAERDEFDPRAAVMKTVLFGHPGVSGNIFDGDEGVWEVNDLEHDAVTFGWEGNNRTVVRAFVDVLNWKLWKLPVLAWVGIRHPIRAARLMYLIAAATGLVWWSDSPHDYSRQMPLAVYWLTN